MRCKEKQVSSGTRFSWKFSGQSYKVFGRKDVDPDTQAVTGGRLRDEQVKNAVLGLGLGLGLTQTLTLNCMYVFFFGL